MNFLTYPIGIKGEKFAVLYRRDEPGMNKRGTRDDDGMKQG
jgi:hypothetical protein